jgi:hypothetical protein
VLQMCFDPASILHLLLCCAVGHCCPAWTRTCTAAPSAGDPQHLVVALTACPKLAEQQCWCEHIHHQATQEAPVPAVVQS